jgi:hypothetical protein
VSIFAYEGHDRREAALLETQHWNCNDILIPKL